MAPAIAAKPFLPVAALRPPPAPASLRFANPGPGFTFRSCDHSSISASAAGFRGVGRPVHGLGHKGLDPWRFMAISGEGSGGGGGFGGSGGGGGGGGDGGSGAGGGAEGKGGGSSLFSWYLTALNSHPVLTKALTAALLNLIGDMICQVFIDQVSKLDLKRSLIFSFLGFILVGPSLHYWYLYLSNFVRLKGTLGTLARLSLDQFIFAPVFLGAFFSLILTLEGRPTEIFPKLRQEWFSSVVANWKLWIPFQFLTFQFVPQQFQVLASNFVALAWNAILSFKAHKEVVLK